MKKFTTYEWLIFIKILENKSDEDILKISSDAVEEFSLKNSNWYSKLLDLALRLSDYENKKVNMNFLPTQVDYKNFISLYLSVYDKESNFTEDLKYSLPMALSKYMYEQLKYYAPPVNDLGRLIELYGGKDDLFKERFGITPKQMIYFYSINSTKHNIYEPFTFDQMLALMHTYDNKITMKKLKRFLDRFSISIRNYRLMAKKMGITKQNMKTERIIEKYPIIALENNYYLIPSINILLSSLTYNIFNILNSMQKDSKRFKTKFGKTFEEYIRNLTTFSHSDYLFECDKLIDVTEMGQSKAEFYLLKENAVLLVEAKLLHIDEHIILNMSTRDIINKFKDTINDALGQINSCFNRIESERKYGIIVIHTQIPMLQNYIDIFKDNIKYDFLENVLILSVIDYEIMMHNSFEKIIEYFNLSNDNKTQVPLFFEQRNKFLIESYEKLVRELAQNLSNHNNIE